MPLSREEKKKVDSSALQLEETHTKWELAFIRTFSFSLLSRATFEVKTGKLKKCPEVSVKLTRQTCLLPPHYFRPP
jgi:hypothetical protein